MTLRRVVVAGLALVAFLLFTAVALPVFVRQAGIGTPPNPAELSRALQAFVGGLVILAIIGYIEQ